MCKIVPAKRSGNGYISFSILASPGWLCVPHKTYFGTNKEEDKPKICPMWVKPKKKRKK
jgi:hypothetical protein